MDPFVAATGKCDDKDEAEVERLKREYGAEVEERTLVEEDVSFAPPKSLRSLTVVR